MSNDPYRNEQTSTYDERRVKERREAMIVAIKAAEIVRFMNQGAEERHPVELMRNAIRSAEGLVGLYMGVSGDFL